MSDDLAFPQADGAEADPLALAQSWLPDNADPERPQITLSTIGTDGFPDSRTVLLTEVGPDGYYFHTDALSRKVTEITADPRVSILVVWPNFSRQLAIQGLAEFADPAEVTAAYERRSPYLKQLAWVNSHDYAQRPLSEREAIWHTVAREHEEEGFAPPETWVGFLVRPTRLTFWVSNPDAASRRAEYVRTDTGWQLTFLPG